METSETLKNLIQSSSGIVLYFYNDSCAPCVALRPKIQEVMDEYFPEMKLGMINSAHAPELSAGYNVFASPTIIIFFEGKEYLRFSKYISIQEFKEKVERYYKMLF